MTTAESSNSTRVSAPVPELRPALSLAPSDAPDDALSVDELGSRIVGLAGRLAAAACRWLLLVAVFDALVEDDLTVEQDDHSASGLNRRGDLHQIPPRPVVRQELVLGAGEDWRRS